MKKLLVYLLIGIFTLAWLTFTATGCNNTDANQNEVELNSGFSIYLVDEPPSGERTNDLAKLPLKDEPWLSMDDFDFYDFSTHFIYLKNDKTSLFIDKNQIGCVTRFVAVANGERCYLGGFTSSICSTMPPQGPIIEFFPLGMMPEDIIAIYREYPVSSSEDLRNDERIKNALSKSGKLVLGLKVALKDVRIISRAETVTLSYTFTITNEGDEALYVPDPDKMGSSLFHYYTNGVILTKTDDYRISIEALYKTVIGPEPFDSWEKSWFTRIGSGNSIERTVILDGYPDIADGTYSCRFNYTGPHNIQRSERILPDGRIWLGTVESGAEFNIRNPIKSTP